MKIDWETGIISFTIKDGGRVDKLVAPIIFKKFYNEMHDQLVEKKFIDMLYDPDMTDYKYNGSKQKKFFDYQAKFGEFVEPKSNKNRNGDLFEQKFFWITHGDGTTETEIVWKARKKSIHDPKHGWYEVKIDITCRRMVNQEILDSNNNKVIFQNGAYEFRNEIIYKNDIIAKKLQNMFLIGKSQKLIELYLERVYGKILQADFDFGIEKIYPMIYGVIDKHFKKN